MASVWFPGAFLLSTPVVCMFQKNSIASVSAKIAIYDYIGAILIVKTTLNFMLWLQIKVAFRGFRKSCHGCKTLALVAVTAYHHKLHKFNMIKSIHPDQLPREVTQRCVILIQYPGSSEGEAHQRPFIGSSRC